MKLAIVLFLAFSVVLATDGTAGNEDGWFVPQSDGGFSWVSKKQSQIDAVTIQTRAINVRFYLYTQSTRNSPRQVSLNDANALWSGKFNSGHQTRIIIHGWQNNYQSDVNREVRNALLDTGFYNVFCVDWSENSMTLNYNSARSAVPEVGQTIAKFIDFLNQQGMSFNNLGLIGHSLGAHVSGYAGRLAKRGRVRTIVGLDPAYPLFSYSDCSTRLCSNDALFVESIQTDGGRLGFLEPIGKAAFYPNGGRNQPGCGSDISGSCAHSRSYFYYAEAIRRNDFPTKKCSTYQTAVNNNCGSSYSSVRMGAASNYGITGYYYVPVRNSYPYGYGS